MPDVARSQIIGGGISDASPFTAGYIPVISNATPPEVTNSILIQVSGGIEFVGTGGYFGDGGGNDGIQILSQAGGGGVYLDDESGTGVYVEDLADDGAGVYILTDDVAPTHYNSGIYIVQQSTDSAGVFILDESTSGNGGVFIETDNANIKLTADGANGKIVFDANTVVRFGSTGLASAVAEQGELSFVFGMDYAEVSAYLSSFQQNLVTKNNIFVYGVNTSPIFQTRRANGTLAAPTAVLINEILVQWGGEGWDGAAFAGSSAQILIRTSENLAAGAHGGRIEFRTVGNGTTAQRLSTTITDQGRLVVAAPASTGETFNLTGFGGAGVPIVRYNGTTNGAAAQAGTLLNAPVAGNPGHWLPVSIAGVVRYIPCW